MRFSNKTLSFFCLLLKIVVGTKVDTNDLNLNACILIQSRHNGMITS